MADQLPCGEWGNGNGDASLLGIPEISLHPLCYICQIVAFIQNKMEMEIPQCIDFFSSSTEFIALCAGNI